MCGICGATNSLDSGLLRAMTATLTHRGPDDQGFLEAPGIALGVRRLSIIDVPGGHQPVANEDGSVTVAFNGEIYNHQALRSRLEGQGHRFRTKSDTEVLVHLYEEYGDALVHLLQGMFAFALWDAKRHRLLLARDRLGIKPLYYAETKEGLVFASEAKALFEHSDIRRQINLDALDLYLSLRYVPGPDTLFRGVKKLPPGHTAVFEHGRLAIRRYWELVLGDFQPAVNLDEAVEEFAALLRDTVRSHLISDVPVGVLLSGGLDSAAVATLMAVGRSGGRAVKTFTVGFEIPGAHNEMSEAHSTATHLGTDHHQLVLSPDAVELLPRLAWHMDEPVADPAALPTYLICRFAREHVPVVLTGEGGDELLAGYPRYVWFDRAHRLQRALPRWVRAGALAASRLAPVGARYHRAFDNVLAERSDVERHLHWVAGVASELRAELASHQPRTTYHAVDAYLNGDGHVIHRLMNLDVHSWLVDDVLHKMDRMSMATSVEARVPFLDHRLVEFVASLPLRVKLANLGTKTLLKRAMAGLLPPATIGRRKHAFQIPLDQWVAGPLRDFVRDTLLDKRARERGWIDTKQLETLLPRLDGQSTWTLLSLELWARAFLD
jgi:asparagine synthase (glutamine-hydrolysing)